ncbi:unnamed protein product [Cylicocyclus nassatus]|uniref:rRNA biogenesis protein RRP36 n=1 Tax=Cylicocyclus nassatus TaxID=53992 RepID=A0AA36DKK6_CYLNA|nr:unnamed protein product [Cylicocyclus nassatus]
MSVDAPRRTFPKKPSSFNLKKNVHKTKVRETMVGGTVLTRKPQRYFVADLSENDGLASKKRKKKVADGLNKAKNGKPVKFASKKKKKLNRGEPVKGTSIDHKMLGGSEDEMYASEDDVVDITDMVEDEDDTAMVPMAHAVKPPTSSAAEKNQDDEMSDEEEVVEFSTGRGSSKLNLSSDTDDDVEAGPSGKNVELDNKEHRSKHRDKVIPRNGMAHKKSDMREIVEIGEADNIRNDVQEEEEEEEADDQEDEGDEDEEAAIANFRADLADLPLGKVREMKEKLGLKLFNKAYFGATEAAKKAEESKKKKLEAKKAEFHGQHRPKEISSKRPVSVFRPIYQENIGKKKRDPRFDSRAGLFKERCFDDNYRFLEDLKRQEKEELSKEAVACEERGDSETAEKIRETIRRMENRERTKAERKMKEETLRELREANIERMMHGERPVFKTKAQVKMMNLEKKFKQLKKDNKLDKYMKRKAKKEAHKDMKKKPSFEEMYGYQ